MSRLAWLSQLCGALSSLLGLAALIGWYTNLPWLCTFGSGKIPMAPSTAFAFLLSGTAIFLFAGKPQDRKVFLTGAISGALVTGMSLILFFLSLSGIHPAFEHLGLPIAGTSNGVLIGHMSPLTAFCFLLSSASFLALLFSPFNRPRGILAAFLPVFFLLLVSTVLIVAYLFGGPLLYDSKIIPPALPTSLAFLALGTSLLFSSIRKVWQNGGVVDTAGTKSTFALILIFLISVTGIITSGYFYFRNYQKHIRAEAERGLSVIADLKVNELSQWRKERLGGGG